jgi:hypothetical protein
MEIFISWSGTTSRKVAEALKEWLPFVINETEAWVSSVDIESGQNWNQEILDKLATASFGIVCVTESNQESTWLNFEAGALVNAFGSGRVAPLAIDLSPTDIKKPLGQFQGPDASLNGIRRLVQSLNSAATRPLDTARVDTAVDAFWPSLETKIHAALSGEGDISPRIRPDRELLEEVVASMRSLSQQMNGSPHVGLGIHDYRQDQKSTSRKMLNYLKGSQATPLTVSFSRDTGWVRLVTESELTPHEREGVVQIAAEAGLEVFFDVTPSISTKTD